MIEPLRTLPTPIPELLGRLRRRIRWYVVAEALTLAVCWVGLAYWIGLALDYLPVLLGSSEMPPAARLVLLAVTATGLLYILYRWLLRRLLVRLHSRHLALLVEKYFPQFHDALLTAVEVSPRELTADRLGQSMLQRTVESASQQAADVDLSRVFNFRPLLRNTVLGAAVLLSIGLFALLARDACALWTSRWLLASDAPWPRRAHIELLGFTDGKLKVAEGSDVTLRVRADANRPTPPPDVCTLYYRLDGGDEGRANMSKDGEPREGYQHYVFQGPPFKGLVEGVQFDVVGYDHRLRDQRVAVVKTPSIVAVELDCHWPAYIDRPPRKLKWRPGTSLPVGTQVTLTVQATKPLRQVQIENVQSGDTRKLELPAEPPQAAFSFDVADLQQAVALNLSLLDYDGVRSQQPYQVTIAAVEDLPPQMDVALRGIGTAITPDARIPLVGQVQDDYGVQRCWLELSQQPESPPFEQTITLAQRGELQTVLDLRQQRSDPQQPLSLQTGQQVRLLVKAQDGCDLKGTPQVGQSDEFPLAVVMPDELLAILEARELNLKRRFEQIIGEMTETRDSLLRLQAEYQPGAEAPAREPGEDPAEPAERQWSLRTLRIQRARQQGEKSQQEVAGVAASFADIREELVNNRIDTEQRKIRLQNQIVEPLQQIADQRFPGWQSTLQQLESQTEKQEVSLALASQAIRQAEEILLDMQRVLEKMIELESYNELVDLMRSVLKEQDELLERTKEQRKEETRSLLED